MEKHNKSKETLSSRDAEIQKFVELAKGLPDVREEKIEAVKRKIESGTYDVSAKLVAGSIVDLHRCLKSDE